MVRAFLPSHRHEYLARLAQHDVALRQPPRCLVTMNEVIVRGSQGDNAHWRFIRLDDSSAGREVHRFGVVGEPPESALTVNRSLRDRDAFAA